VSFCKIINTLVDLKKSSLNISICFLRGFLEHPNAGKTLAPLVSIFNTNPEMIANIEKYPATEKDFMTYFARLVPQLDPVIIDKLITTRLGTER
jgi:hypothetical protein